MVNDEEVGFHTEGTDAGVKREALTRKVAVGKAAIGRVALRAGQNTDSA